MRKATFFFGLLLITILFGCAGTPITRFYVVEIPDQPATNKTFKFPVSIGITRTIANDPYTDDRLIYRESVYEFKFYHYHRWVVQPSRMITDKLVTRLKTSGLFKNVMYQSAENIPDYVLNSHLKSFEEWDRGEQWFGKINLWICLKNQKTHEIIWEKEIQKMHPATERTPLAVVQALSAGLEVCLQEILVELEQEFSHKKE